MTAKTPFPHVGGSTPGPWTVHRNDYNAVIVKDGKSIAGVFPESLDGTELPCVANARLIAAAPDLLEALRDMLTCSQPQDSTKPGFVYVAEAQEKAAAAIKKATQP